MMPGFSEFSYGFAFTHEYVNLNPGLKAAPELPSLIKEAETGYDLKLDYKGHPKYFQFKLSTYLDRRNALHWPSHHRSHYRVRISTRPKSNRFTATDQHSRLKRLSTNVDDVFYVAPKFHSEDEFNFFFVQGRITENSLWAPLKELPWISDHSAHYMTFTKDDGQLWWHSEAIQLEGHFLAEEHSSSTRELVTIDEAFYRDLRSKLRAGLNDLEQRDPEVPYIDHTDGIASLLTEVYRLLTTQYGLQMIILVEDGG